MIWFVFCNGFAAITTAIRWVVPDVLDPFAHSGWESATFPLDPCKANNSKSRLLLSIGIEVCNKHRNGAMNANYYTDDSRKCRFSLDYVTPGYRGLAWAVLLKAIEDGCSREWLLDIVRYYDISLDDELLSRLPANKIKVNGPSREMIGIHFEHSDVRRKSLLSMHDGLYIRGLAKVASGNRK